PVPPAPGFRSRSGRRRRSPTASPPGTPRSTSCPRSTSPPSSPNGAFRRNPDPGNIPAAVRIAGMKTITRRRRLRNRFPGYPVAGGRMTPDIPRDTLLRARMGDRDAFRTVLESVQKLAYNIAFRLTWNASDAEDATQEIFLRLFRNFPQYDPEQPFLPWFRRLATNCTLNWKEKRR